MSALPVPRARAPEPARQLETRLLLDVRLHNFAPARSRLRSLLLQLMEVHRGDPVATKAHLINLLVLISRTLLEAGAEGRSLLPCHLRWVTAVLRCEDVARLPELADSAYVEYVSQSFARERVHCSQPIRDVLDFLHQNFTRSDLNLRQIARHVFLNPTYLSHRFSKEVGITLTQYIMRLRLAAAQDYLRTTEMGVAEVAEAVGYNDAAHFCRLFQRSFQMTPKGYRDRCRQPIQRRCPL